MASDKRPILSGKRARSRRKRAALRAANRATASPTPECDSDEGVKRKLQELTTSRGDSTSSDKATPQSENNGEFEEGLVFVCRPTMPDFCSVFLPQGDSWSRKLQTSDCKTFTVRIPTFRETCEGFVTYTLQLTTCGEPRHTFQLERRFSEFVDEEDESKVAVSVEDRNFQWELPAKTWFRVTQTGALEERRAQLERSLETLLLQQDRRVCNMPLLRDFLLLDIFGVQVAEQRTWRPLRTLSNETLNPMAASHPHKGTHAQYNHIERGKPVHPASQPA
ncbi:hypothetical protein PRIC1_006686 [Phytophthora ramorum]